jgi:hypothetical protein
MPALETIHGYVTYSNSTETALTMDGTDSLTVRNFRMPKKAFVLQTWAWLNAAGYTVLRSPRMHDNVEGIRIRFPAAYSMPVVPKKHKQEVFAQDTLIARLLSADASGNIEQMMMLLYYEDIDGINAHLITPEELKSRRKHTFVAEVAPTYNATGVYFTAAAINSVYDLFKANTEYAVLGAVTDQRAALVTLKGPDTGNLRVGVPGELYSRQDMSHWFEDLSFHTGIPLIPVINSANKFGTFCEVVSNQAQASNINVSWILAELAAM